VEGAVRAVEEVVPTSTVVEDAAGLGSEEASVRRAPSSAKSMHESQKWKRII
jgi:hypothetical protein